MLSQAFRVLLGNYYLVLVILMMILCLINLWMPIRGMGSFSSVMAIFFVVLTLELSFCIDMDPSLDAKAVLDIGFGHIASVYDGSFNGYGGMIGCALYALNLTLFGRQGMVILILLLASISIIFFIVSFYWRAFFAKVKDFLTLPSRLISIEADDDASEAQNQDNVEYKRAKDSDGGSKQIDGEDPTGIDMIDPSSQQGSLSPLKRAVRYLSDTPSTPKPSTSLFIDANDQPVDMSVGVINDDETAMVDTDDQHLDDGLTILTDRESIQTDQPVTSKRSIFINADELMERFVRGDDSRNTEGSGLGLNIAKSLMELQKGQLQLLVDGDLFKVTLIFPSI